MDGRCLEIVTQVLAYLVPRRAALGTLTVGTLAAALGLAPDEDVAACRRSGKGWERGRQCCSGRCRGGKCDRCKDDLVGCDAAVATSRPIPSTAAPAAATAPRARPVSPASASAPSAGPAPATASSAIRTDWPSPERPSSTSPTLQRSPPGVLLDRRVHPEVGRPRRRQRTVRRTLRRRGRWREHGVRRRSRQPPHPDVRRRWRLRPRLGQPGRRRRPVLRSGGRCRRRRDLRRGRREQPDPDLRPRLMSPPGQAITARATSEMGGDTSEFSQPAVVERKQ